MLIYQGTSWWPRGQVASIDMGSLETVTSWHRKVFYWNHNRPCQSNNSYFQKISAEENIRIPDSHRLEHLMVRDHWVHPVVDGKTILEKLFFGKHYMWMDWVT